MTTAPGLPAAPRDGDADAVDDAALVPEVT
jgi:hypothetical protein